MPIERNPARGWVASANGRIVGPQYPYPLRGQWEPRFRIQRIADVLDSRATHSPAEMRLLQTDRFSLHAAEMTPFLVDNLGDDAPRWAVDDLRGWDYQAAAESRATLLFQSFYNRWVFASLERRLPDDLIDRVTANVSGEAQFAFYDRLLKGELDAWFGGADDRRRVVVQTFDESLSWITERLGPDHEAWTWGALHQVTFRHPFANRPGPHARIVNVGPFPIGGDRTTVWMSWWDLRRPFDVLGGPSMRFVADLRRDGANWLTNTLGASERPLSRHYRDQAADFVGGRTHPFPADGRRPWVTIVPGRSGDVRREDENGEPGTGEND
jgi:penicillin amidase